MSNRLQYVWQRSKNAARMLRHGEFGKIAQVAVSELRYYFRDIPPSAYHDRTRLDSPSPRPTRLSRMAPPEIRGDRQQIGDKIRDIVADIDVDEGSEP